MKVSDLPKFDAANYLLTADDDEAYMNEWLEDGTDEEIQAAISTVARARGMRSVAEATGLNRTSAYKSFSKDGNPSFASVKAMFESAGLQLVVKRSGKSPRQRRPRGRPEKAA